MPSRKSRIDRVLEQQDADLATLEDDELRRFLVIYEGARQRLRDELDALEASGDDQVLEFTSQHLRVMLVQTETGVATLQRRLERALDDGVRRAQEKSVDHLLGVIKAAEPRFTDAGNRIEHRLLRRLARERGLLVHRFSVRRYTADVLDTIQRELTLGLAMGRTIPQIRDQLFARAGSAMANRRARAELIVRMELNGGYNKGHQAAAEEAHKVLDEPGSPDPLLKRVDEFRDLRNHAISRALDNQVQPIREPFRVSLAAVQTEHAILQAERVARNLPARRLGGITWPLVGGFYVGMTQPAHFWDRGRQVPHRRSWES